MVEVGSSLIWYILYIFRFHTRRITGCRCWNKLWSNTCQVLQFQNKIRKYDMMVHYVLCKGTHRAKLKGWKTFRNTCPTYVTIEFPLYSRHQCFNFHRFKNMWKTTVCPKIPKMFRFGIKQCLEWTLIVILNWNTMKIFQDLTNTYLNYWPPRWST